MSGRIGWGGGGGGSWEEVHAPTPTLASSSSAFPATSLGFIILDEIFAYLTVFYSNRRGSHIPTSWMAHAGCVFVAGIRPSRT